MNSKYYHGRQPTCNILIKFTYLVSDDVKTASSTHAFGNIYYQLPALEQVRVVNRALKVSMMVLLAKIVVNVNFKDANYSRKRLILDAWLGPEAVVQRCSVKKVFLEIFL